MAEARHELDDQARVVWGSYPEWLTQEPLESLGNHGGFSGARLWRWTTARMAFVLRAWPRDVDVTRLAFVHRWMRQAREAGLAFVPVLIPTCTSATWMAHGGRLWEVLEWLPGRADFSQRPSRARLTAACEALARLHQSWSELRRVEHAPYPAVRRRMEQYSEWDRWLLTGGRPALDDEAADPASTILQRAWRILPRWISHVTATLAHWYELRSPHEPVQPCLCDPWHDHLLFEDDRLTGIVDYGSVKVDHPAVDLARMLGSLMADDDEGWRLGLEAYRRVRPFGGHEEKLARMLDRTGTIIGVANWVRWLSDGTRELADRRSAAKRLDMLVARLERWC
jgi:homoserine kinase type II